MLNAQLLFEFALYFAELWETILFGLFTALLLFSVCVLIDRGLEETGRRILLAVMVLMWVIAVVHWAISIVITGYDTSGQIADSSLDKVAMVAVFLNLTISDAIVMSRAWHLWERSRVVLLISVLLAMLSFTSIVLNFSGLADSDIPVPEAVNAVAFLPQNEFAVEIGGLVAVIFSIVSNLWAFGLVATKAWKHRQFLKAQLYMKRRRTRMENVLALLLESGAIYAAFWIILVVLRTISNPLVVAAHAVLSESVCQISGIYPTALIILISREVDMSADRISTFAPRSVATPHGGEQHDNDDGTTRRRTRSTSDLSLITLMMMRNADPGERQSHEEEAVVKIDLASV